MRNFGTTQSVFVGPLYRSGLPLTVRLNGACVVRPASVCGPEAIRTLNLQNVPMRRVELRDSFHGNGLFLCSFIVCKSDHLPLIYEPNYSLFSAK